MKSKNCVHFTVYTLIIFDVYLEVNATHNRNAITNQGLVLQHSGVATLLFLPQSVRE